MGEDLRLRNRISEYGWVVCVIPAVGLPLLGLMLSAVLKRFTTR